MHQMLQIRDEVGTMLHEAPCSLGQAPADGGGVPIDPALQARHGAKLKRRGRVPERPVALIKQTFVMKKDVRLTGV